MQGGNTRKLTNIKTAAGVKVRLRDVQSLR